MADPVVRGQDIRLPVLLRLAAGHPAPVPLRPVDGPGLEDPHPAGHHQHRDNRVDL